MHRGFTFVEILVVIGVVTVVAVFSFVSLVNLQRSQALDKDTDRVAALIERARSLTLSSSGDTQYGVHFESLQAVLFSGATYNSVDPTNRPETLNPRITISSIVLTGGGVDMVFDRLTGVTTKPGTITLSRSDDPSEARVIQVLGTGIIERK